MNLTSEEKNKIYIVSAIIVIILALIGLLIFYGIKEEKANNKNNNTSSTSTNEITTTDEIKDEENTTTTSNVSTTNNVSTTTVTTGISTNSTTTKVNNTTTKVNTTIPNNNTTTGQVLNDFSLAENAIKKYLDEFYIENYIEFYEINNIEIIEKVDCYNLSKNSEYIYALVDIYYEKKDSDVVINSNEVKITGNKYKLNAIYIIDKKTASVKSIKKVC